MTSKFVLTLDTPGERDWLKTKFPNCVNFETEYSGLWPASIADSPTDSIFEVPPESAIDLYSLPNDKVLSLYKNQKNFKWCDSNYFISDFDDYRVGPKSKYVQVLTLMRCGTKFLESILYSKCNYNTASPFPLSEGNTFHAFTGDLSHDLDGLIKSTAADVFICYRQNWWAWVTSYLVGQKLGGFVHHDTNVNWNEIQLNPITEKELEEVSTLAKYAWDSVCNLRLANPHLNFYIMEFNDIIKYRSYTDHKAVDYNKKEILKNYGEAEQMFRTNHLPKLEYWRTNAFHHLKQMNCQFIDSLETFLP